ncbi:MAG: isoleucine--tRNA ligase [Parachlamydia sp.]|nr:isoleucine--tRNA ligase [Parachlamydia sp.]
MFEEIQDETFDQREVRILNFWQKGRIFERSVEERKGQPYFSQYDGPPFATGLPHYGHYLAGTIKDVVLRYKTMKGYYAPRRFGWDCHGLPIENEIEKAFNLTGATSIEAFGIAKFNEECRKIVLRYTEEWKELVQRMGRWVDFSNTYHTMDLSFMESVWWVFKQLHDKGLVYEGFKVMPFSAKLGTPLSNFEAGENYKDVDDPSLTVAFTLVDEPETALLAWTTTPWTLVSNLAVMVGPEIDYVKIRTDGRQYILAKARLSAYYKDESAYTILEEFKGKTLAGRHYQPLLPYFADRASQGAFRVILEESIALDEGTGIVHSAPAFGEVDFYACRRAGIDLVCPVDNNGRFTETIPEYAGQFVKDADKEIIRRLKKENAVIQHATMHHRYPFCWRSDTPLIYKALQTWFVAVEKIKEELLESNRQIQWKPEHIKFGRFGKWLENARDWAISRNRYWGTPIPIWRSDDGEIVVFGSIAELEALTGKKIHDLHRQYIDELTFTRNGKHFKRIPEVFDCWFESGSMPYAQSHYPFEHRDWFSKGFPADFIGEGLDQTRGWFYTLTILATALFNKPAFKNVIVNGIILAEDGNKMSKRLRNYPDPSIVVQKYGADAVRLYMMHSPAVRADDLRFSESGVELVLRQILIPLWNAYSFFISYARLYNWRPMEHLKEHYPPSGSPHAIIDQWILSLFQKVVLQVETGMDNYNLNDAVEPFVGFIDQLTNWYIRRSRRRFWEDQATPDRDQAFATLYQVLLGLAKVAAPFVPFISEAIYLNLRQPHMPESVHLCHTPVYHPDWRNELLEREMDDVQKAVSLGHSLRKEHKLKVRQPLPSAYIISSDPELIHSLRDQQHLIADELNVKEVLFETNEEQFVSLTAKPNFRVLGKKVGKMMKAAQAAIEKMNQKLLLSLMEGENVKLTIEGEQVELTPEDVQVERKVRDGMVAANLGELTIALNTALSNDLLEEGLAREIVNKINTMRRESNFDISDRIHVRIQSTQDVQNCFAKWGPYIQNEVLALTVEFADNSGTAWDLNGQPAKIELIKV